MHRINRLVYPEINPPFAGVSVSPMSPQPDNDAEAPSLKKNYDIVHAIKCGPGKVSRGVREDVGEGS
jgi:hypothetical protein